jgi:hypothetical protein
MHIAIHHLLSRLGNQDNLSSSRFTRALSYKAQLVRGIPAQKSMSSSVVPKIGNHVFVTSQWMECQHFDTLA